MCDAGVLSFHALLAFFLHQQSLLEPWAVLSARTEAYLRSGADRLVLVCAALFGTSQASQLAQSNLLSSGMSADRVPRADWARMRHQPKRLLSAFYAGMEVPENARGRDVHVPANMRVDRKVFLTAHCAGMAMKADATCRDKLMSEVCDILRSI
jgi:hypothetical protein